MNIICKPRGCEKTYDLIMESARTGHPIVTATSAEAMFVNEEAKRMGVKIKQPISVREYGIFKSNGSLFNSPSLTGKVLIDNVDLVLRNLLKAEVVTVTCTLDNMKENNNMDRALNYIKECRIENGNDVIDVNIIVPDKVVEVTFLDGTKEKSVCREPDVFSLEQAIGICVSKKVMGGSSAYNNAIKRGLKVYENKIHEEQIDEEEQERIERKRAKKKAYKERRAAKRALEETKRALEEREKQIEIQKEAYIRAMMEVENMKNKGV